MGGIINDFLKTLKPKEKAIVISSMAALGVVLIGIVLLIAFCSKDATTPGGIKPHEHSFDKYSLEFDAGLFNVKGACSFEGCDEAKILETGVTVTNLPKKEATCTEQGEIVCVYSYNGTTLQYPVTVAKKAHNFEYTLNGNQLSGKCTADGCNETNEVTATSLVKMSETEATCKDVSKTVYAATLPDGSIVQVIKLGTDKLSAHKLNGTVLDTSVVYDYADFDDIDINCGETSDFQFVCDFCKTNQAVKVERRESHSVVFDMSSLVKPTTKKEGSIMVRCTKDGCTLHKEEKLPKIETGKVYSDTDAFGNTVFKYRYEIYGKALEFELPTFFG